MYQNYTTLSAIVPRQIKPNEVSTIKTTSFFSSFLMVFFVCLVILSFITRSSIFKYLYMLNELQLIFHLPLMHLYVPGNVLIVFTHMINLVRYDFIKQLRLADYSESVRDANDKPHFNFSGYWFELGYKSYNIYSNFGFMFYFIIFAMVLRLARYCSRTQGKRCKQLKPMLRRFRRLSDIDVKAVFVIS